MWRKGININSLSLCSHYLRMIFGETDTIISTGTGFIYEHEHTYYLITNGHNLTGINPETGERLANHSGFPTLIRTKARLVPSDNPEALVTDFFDIALYTDENYQVPRWFIHPLKGYTIDVVAIPILEKLNIAEGVKLFPLNNVEFDTQFPPEVSDNVFILGYPFDITGGKELPIWKRGTIATEVGIDLDDLPKLLVDTATRSGMSGSPVIYERSGYHRTPDGDTNKDIIGRIRGFLGIYSGRIGAEDNFKSQLGIVWKPQVIEEILMDKIKGTISFQNK